MLLIKNGRVLDPASKTDARLDVLIDKGRIAKSPPESPFPMLWSSTRRIASSRQASSTSIATCASPARRFPRQSNPAHNPPRAEGSPRFVPCPTRSP